MGDSIAPKITLTDTKDAATSKVSIVWEKLAPKDAMAVDVTANTALAASLKSVSKVVGALPTTTAPPPPSVAPADHYFPSGVRNIAPVISLTDDKVAVSMSEINPKVGGISANAPESVAFWKAKSYKYSAPPTPDSVAPETISTELFESFIPSSRRNIAPVITMKKPAGDWDTTAYVTIGSEYVGFSTELAQKLKVKLTEEDVDLRAAAVVEKYFGEKPSAAPVVEIDESNETVTFGMQPIESNISFAETVKHACSSY